MRDHSGRQSRDIAARLAERDVMMIDGPVSGGAAKAAAGAMTVMASGPDAAFSKAAPVLDAIAEQVHRLGAEAGVGSTVKTINQLLAGVHIAAAAEAMALASAPAPTPISCSPSCRVRPAPRGCSTIGCRISWPATTRPVGGRYFHQGFGHCARHRQSPDISAAAERRRPSAIPRRRRRRARPRG